jgi:hypothetical protein
MIGSGLPAATWCGLPLPQHWVEVADARAELASLVGQARADLQYETAKAIAYASLEPNSTVILRELRAAIERVLSGDEPVEITSREQAYRLFGKWSWAGEAAAEAVERNQESTIVAIATGNDLDRKAARMGLHRKINETDESLRARVYALHDGDHPRGRKPWMDGLHVIAWRHEGSDVVTRGQPLPLAEATAIVSAMNRDYPGVLHWVESIGEREAIDALCNAGPMERREFDRSMALLYERGLRLRDGETSTDAVELCRLLQEARMRSGSTEAAVDKVLAGEREGRRLDPKVKPERKRLLTDAGGTAGGWGTPAEPRRDATGQVLTRCPDCSRLGTVESVHSPRLDSDGRVHVRCADGCAPALRVATGYLTAYKRTAYDFLQGELDRIRLQLHAGEGLMYNRVCESPDGRRDVDALGRRLIDETITAAHADRDPYPHALGAALRSIVEGGAWRTQPEILATSLMLRAYENRLRRGYRPERATEEAEATFAESYESLSGRRLQANDWIPYSALRIYERERSRR